MAALEGWSFEKRSPYVIAFLHFFSLQPAFGCQSTADVLVLLLPQSQS